MHRTSIDSRLYHRHQAARDQRTPRLEVLLGEEDESHRHFDLTLG
jgi:hypothetical protein